MSDEATHEVTIKAGRSFDVMTEERRAAVDELAAAVRATTTQPTVEVTLTEYVPGSRSMGVAEQVAIFVGTSAGSGLVGAVVTDVYSAAKTWARRRFAAKDDSRPEYVVVEDDQGHKWTFKITKEGESDDEPSS